MISPNHKIDRSRVNQSAVNASQIPTSGFNKSYKSYSTFNIGRLHVSGYQHMMPNEKFRGSNQASLTFFRLNQPNVSDVHISQHNFYVPYRIIDDTFEEALTPTSQNSMSSDWTAPAFSLFQIVKTYQSYHSPATLTALWTDFLADLVLDETHALTASKIAAIKSYGLNLTFLAALKVDFTNHYLGDWIDDVFVPRVNALFSGLSTNLTNIEGFRIMIDACLFPFIGEGSLLDELGYIYVRRSDLHSIKPGSLKSADDICDLFSSVEQNEYALRAYYAVWYEYYRDNNLEPKRSSLTNYKKLGSISVCSSHLSFLVNRFRAWTKDVYTTSLPDDIMRHVYAPCLSGNNGAGKSIAYDNFSTDFEYAESNVPSSSKSRNIVATVLSYRDPVTGLSTDIKCPLPKQVNDVISMHLDGNTSFTSSVASLDLFTLRNAQSLERYLKRNFYFGDEYQDRMLAHYGSYISDFRVNRPEFLSSSLSPINPNQVVSSAGTERTPQGERNMTITATTSSDRFDFRSEEFGIVLNIISVMPVAQYAGVCPHNMLSHAIDYPLPEFAANNEEFSRVYEIAFSGLASSQERIKPTFGHHPYAHVWRSRINEVHKEYLSDLQELTFRRLFGMDDDNRVPKLNSSFIHCKPNLGMFIAGHDQLFTPQLYGVVHHSFFTETPLPTPVENI